MALHCIALPPSELFAEPDPDTIPSAYLDASSVLKILAELGDWAKVEVQGATPPFDAGWIKKQGLIPIDPSKAGPLLLLPEPLAAGGRSITAQVIQTLVEIADWAKVRVWTNDGRRLTGWITRKAPEKPAVADTATGLELGINDVYRDALLQAQKKTGIDAAALAATIDAEAGTIGDGPEKGRWNAKAFNQSSKAAGLTQFLASTWLSHAKSAGTELRRVAAEKGLLDASGAIVPGREDDLLDLRFDPTLSIMSAAEYGAINLKGLIGRGLVKATADDDRKAWLMYLAHHEGLAGAAQFLRQTKTYSEANLAGQVGAAAARDLVARSGGDANLAYRNWLTGYIDRKIRPAKFRKGRAGPSAALTGDAAAFNDLAKHAGQPEEVVAYSGLDSGAKSILEGYSGPAIPFPAIGGNVALATAIQQALSVHGYLDPPADGEFGPISIWALTQFCKEMGLPTEHGLSQDVTSALAKETNGLPVFQPTGGWIDKLILFLREAGYFVCRHPDCRNIAYVEGMNVKGQPIVDVPNHFNDLRVVFWIGAAGKPEFQVWEATSEPGDFWTQNPMSPQGAARIAFRQYKSWAVGKHLAGKASGHEALVQVKPVTVHRDLNKDHKRSGDQLDRGIFGINQHWGYDAPPDDIKNTSAGCLVGRLKEGHREFMTLIKGDARYKTSKAYRFVTAIVPGDRLGL